MVSGPDQLHTGIIFRHQGRVHFLHLAWHHQLRCDPASKYDNRLYWATPVVDSLLLQGLADACESLRGQLPSTQIGYAFFYDGLPAFDPETYRYLRGPTKTGLTCATFVLALCQDAGIRLVEIGTWPARTCDLAWKQRILAALEEHGADSEHIQHLRSTTDCARFRPEEVLGVCGTSGVPTSFDAALGCGQAVLQTMKMTHLWCYFNGMLPNNLTR